MAGGLLQTEDGPVEDEEAAAEKRKLLFVMGLALCLIVGATTAAYFSDRIILMMESSGARQVADADDGPAPVFYDLPEISVNLHNVIDRVIYMKIRLCLELGSEKDLPKVAARMPYVMDDLQLYLRELRVQELEGAQGLQRLRKQLFSRVVTVTAPAQVETLLFKEMMVQ
jgi:flagellar protein FliL